jgi:hypothetical protein
MKHEIKGLVAHDNIKKIKQVKVTITKAKKLPQKHSKNDAKHSQNYTTKCKAHMTYNPHISTHFEDMNSKMRIKGM